MARQTRNRLFLALFVLALTLGFTAVADQAATAAPPCSACDYQQESCEAGIIYPWCNCDPVCCDTEVTNRCWRWCIE
jgi:hypothetical protein